MQFPHFSERLTRILQCLFNYQWISIYLHRDFIIRFDEKNARWSAKSTNNDDFIAFTISLQIFGTTSWILINDSNLCPDSKHTTKTITFSYCSNDDFTCADGYCVDLDLRCDGRSDCKDGSDEQESF